MEQRQSQAEKPKTNLDKIRRGSGMLAVGVVGLVILALMTLRMAIETTQVPAEMRSMSYWPTLAMPIYLVIGGVSLIYSARASVLYKKDLYVVSMACLIGLVLAFWGQLLWVGMIFALLIYYGLLFWWLIRRHQKRVGYLIHAEQLRVVQNGEKINNRARRTAMVTVATVVVSFLVPLLAVAGFFIAIISSSHLDTAMVREEFEKSVFPDTPYFAISEDKSKAKKDKIF